MNSKYVAPEVAYDYFLGTLSNRNRIKILIDLLDGDMNVSALTDSLKVDQSTISNNLARLKSCGFVTVTRKGKERIYSLNKKTITPLMKLMTKHVTKYCVECVKK